MSDNGKMDNENIREFNNFVLNTIKTRMNAIDREKLFGIGIISTQTTNPGHADRKMAIERMFFSAIIRFKS